MLGDDGHGRATDVSGTDATDIHKAETQTKLAACPPESKIDFRPPAVPSAREFLGAPGTDPSD
jgi:hypothetical protein